VHIRWGAGLPPPAPEEGGKDESRKQRKRREKKQKLGISPYCTVSAGPAACVSRPVDGSQDAQWRESYFLYIRCVSCCRADTKEQETQVGGRGSSAAAWRGEAMLPLQIRRTGAALNADPSCAHPTKRSKAAQLPRAARAAARASGTAVFLTNGRLRRCRAGFRV